MGTSLEERVRCHPTDPYNWAPFSLWVSWVCSAPASRQPDSAQSNPPRNASDLGDPPSWLPDWATGLIDLG
jgi:hypothetical protein